MKLLHAISGVESSLTRRRLLAPALGALYSDYGFCACCEWPWTLAPPYETPLSEWSGCFILCRFCWAFLRRFGREHDILDYYRCAWSKYSSNHPWERYERALLLDLYGSEVGGRIRVAVKNIRAGRRL